MARISKLEADHIMAQRGWLALLPDAVRTEILNRSRVVNFAPGEPIFHLGDPVGGIYGLASGTVSVSIAPAGATPRLILLGIPGHWTGEACFLTRQPRRGELRAVVETTMLYLPLEAMDQMAARRPDMVHHVALILMMSVEFLLRVIHDLQKPEADRRIASVIQRTTWIGEIPIPLTQSEIGIMANASRKQVNAAVKRFAEAGWLTKTYRSITIVDVQALRSFAQGDDTD
jgi:CRP/FNR family cyclic AMP-dependent transcriptional regulator